MREHALPSSPFHPVSVALPAGYQGRTDPTSPSRMRIQPFTLRVAGGSPQRLREPAGRVNAQKTDDGPRPAVVHAPSGSPPRPTSMHVRPRLSGPERRLARDEHGFTMIFALVVLLVGALLTAAALAAASEDVSLTRTYSSQQSAYAAAVAGIDEYKYQMSANPNYWNTCPSATNVKVPGSTEEAYSVKTLPATGHEKCESGKPASIVEARTSAAGTFRIESTGTSAGKSRSIVATFRHPGFINYVFLSNYEIEDPVTQSPEPTDCEYYYKERQEKGVKDCQTIQWGVGDHVLGPFHTNDSANIQSGGETTTFGREGLNDAVEMNGGHYGGTPTIRGKGYTESAGTLLPPETDVELLEAAEYKFTGRTIIELKPGTPNVMAVTLSNGTKETKNFPGNGVVYVQNGAKGCPIKYTPFLTRYTGDTECGNVYVKGSYTESLTIAAANDVIVVGSITTTSEGSGRPTGAATLGLIATNFVRVYHPVSENCGGKCEASNSGCNAENASAAEAPKEFGVSIENPVIDAAILSTKHSWIVDNFPCGAGLGYLTVWGSIAQFWRGAVKRGGSGYYKSYNYDERLATNQPPSFLAPTTNGGWKISRETAPQNGCC